MRLPKLSFGKKNKEKGKGGLSIHESEGHSVEHGEDTADPRNRTASDTVVLDESVTVRILTQEDAGAGHPDPVAKNSQQSAVLIGCASLKGTRDYQQDAFSCKTSEWRHAGRCRAAAVLCDGMGGLNAGEKASGLAARRLMEELDVPWECFPGIYPDALSDINYEVAHLKDEAGTFLRTGTTAVSVVIECGLMYYASVGDSRIYLIRNEQARCLTRDHTYGNELDEKAAAGRIPAEEARNADNRAALTSYLGGRRLEQICRNEEAVSLTAGDIVLLCSDGLYKSLSEMEIACTASSSGNDMQLAARRLTELATGRPGRHDNTSVVLLEYTGNPTEEPGQVYG